MRRANPSLRVLLVVPDEQARGDVHLLQHALDATGMEIVGQASSESRALQLYFQAQPDAVVLDWRVAPDEPARFVGLLKRMAPGSFIVVAVPALDSMPARAARALGADAISAPADIPALLVDRAPSLLF